MRTAEYIELLYLNIFKHCASKYHGLIFDEKSNTIFVKCRFNNSVTCWLELFLFCNQTNVFWEMISGCRCCNVSSGFIGVGTSAEQHAVSCYVSAAPVTHDGVMQNTARHITPPCRQSVGFISKEMQVWYHWLWFYSLIFISCMFQITRLTTSVRYDPFSPPMKQQQRFDFWPQQHTHSVEPADRLCISD